MDKRAISDRQRAWLLDELQSWQAQAILSPEQSQSIQQLYESTAQNAGRRRSWAVLALMGVAATLVGLAVLLLIGYNWDAMPRQVKLMLIFGAIIAAHGTGYYLRYVRGSSTLSEVAFFLGCLFYGAGIWLVAQIFHINAHYPDGVWWWAVGVLPFALCLDTLLFHFLLAALLAIWVGMEILGFGHLGAWLFGRWSFLPNGAYSLPLMALPGLLWAYRKGSPLTVGLYALLIGWWVVLQPFAWEQDNTNAIFFIGSVGALFLVIAECHRVGSPFAIPYRLIGVLLAGGVLVVLSFYDFYQEIAYYNEGLSGLYQTLAIFLLAAAVLVVVTIIKRRTLGPTAETLTAFMQRQWLPIGLVVLMAGLSLWSAMFITRELRGTGAIVPTILANVAMIGCALWLITVGLREDRGLPFGAGVAYFLLWAVLRYFDLFGDFGGMLGAAALFLLCGAAMFGVALYWHRRKEVHHA